MPGRLEAREFVEDSGAPQRPLGALFWDREVVLCGDPCWLSRPTVEEVRALTNLLCLADYDAVLTEAGDYTEKYYTFRRLFTTLGTLATSCLFGVGRVGLEGTAPM